jgi:hypothetical protein
VTYDDERRRLLSGPAPGESPGGAGTITFMAWAPEPTMVLNRVREALFAVMDGSADGWPDHEEWLRLLPRWLVEAAAPERSAEDVAASVAAFRSMSAEERAVAETQPWALSEWLYAMQPVEREWNWWTGSVGGASARVEVAVPGSPVALGALEFLLRAAGATEIDDDR